MKLMKVIVMVNVFEVQCSILAKYALLWKGSEYIFIQIVNY